MELTHLPAEFWWAMASQIAAGIGALLRVEHRLTKLEAGLEYLTRRRRNDREDNHGAHPGS